MAAKAKIVGEVVMAYLTKFPNTSKISLAKKIFEENKPLFETVESARSLIRYYTMASGGKRRESKGVASNFYKAFVKLKKDLPKGESERHLPLKLPKSVRRVLILGDIHFPFQNDEALHAALEFGNEKDIDCVYLNGDIMDAYQLSRHEKDPRRRSFSYELDCTRTFLTSLREMFPNALIYYKIGNHDARYEKFIIQAAPHLLDIEAVQLSELLKFKELNIQEVKSMQWAYIGKLPILHGHELPVKSGGVNPARTVQLKLNKQGVVNHFHRETRANGKHFDDNVYTTYSLGCLCDLFPNYMPINEWGHGFGYVEVEPNGNYQMFQKTVINGKIF